MHPHLPHLPAALVAVTLVHALAIAVALAHPGRPTLAGLVVLAGLTARWVAHHRRAAVRATVTATAPAPAPDVAPATAA